MGRDREMVIDFFFTNARLMEGGNKMKSLSALKSGMLELGVVKRENV